jgi:hypothetical protein
VEKEVMLGYIVITSINQLTDAVIEFSKLKNWNILLVSDLKSVSIDSFDNLVNWLDDINSIQS